MPFVTIDRVSINSNRRPLSDQKVAELMQSIQTNGLLNPITLDQHFNLIAGLHRLTACKLLGLEEIEYKVINCEDQDHARLAEIDENLIRNELEALDRAEMWLERDQILERLGLRAKRGDNQFSHKGREIGSLPVKTTLELAREVGYTERTFQHGKQIAKNIAPEVKDLIKGTPIAKSPSVLLKIARAGSKERERAEQAEQAAQEAKTKRKQAELEQQAKLATAARAKQKELQLVTLKSATAEKEAKQTVRGLQRGASLLPTGQPHLADKSAAGPNPIEAESGEEWLLGSHLVYCGDTTGEGFLELLPSNAALAIVLPSAKGEHDYLIDEARVVAVLRSEGTIYEFCSRSQMPVRFEVLLGGVYVAICSHTPLQKPEHTVNVEGVEGIVAYLVSLYTQSGNFVVASSLGHGEVLITCERLKRICFTGDEDPERVNRAIARWQQWTGKQATRT
jgi:ParB family chromosome partitioning protein